MFKVSEGTVGVVSVPLTVEGIRNALGCEDEGFITMVRYIRDRRYVVFAREEVSEDTVPTVLGATIYGSTLFALQGKETVDDIAEDSLDEHIIRGSITVGQATCRNGKGAYTVAVKVKAEREGCRAVEVSG